MIYPYFTRVTVHDTMESSHSESDDRNHQELIMDFSFDVGDILEDVGEVARQSTIGRFKIARAVSKNTLEKHMEKFPIAIEVLRLLYDQGEHRDLHRKIRSLSRHKQERNDQSICDTWSDGEKNIIDLMDAVTMVSVHGNSRKRFDDSGPTSKLIMRFKQTSWLELEEEQVSL